MPHFNVFDGTDLDDIVLLIFFYAGLLSVVVLAVKVAMDKIIPMIIKRSIDEVPVHDRATAAQDALRYAMDVNMVLNRVDSQLGDLSPSCKIQAKSNTEFSGR